MNVNEIEKTLTECDIAEKKLTEDLENVYRIRAKARAAEESNIKRHIKAKNDAYHERNILVATLAMFFPSGIAKTAIEDWDAAWHNCVYIDLPTGQASWHYHDSDQGLFAHLPPYKGAWDGHTNDVKYNRLAALGKMPIGNRVIGALKEIKDFTHFWRTWADRIDKPLSAAAGPSDGFSNYIRRRQSIAAIYLKVADVLNRQYQSHQSIALLMEGGPSEQGIKSTAEQAKKYANEAKEMLDVIRGDTTPALAESDTEFFEKWYEQHPKTRTLCNSNDEDAAFIIARDAFSTGKEFQRKTD